MSYSIYHTDAFIVKSKPYGEDGKLFCFFSYEFGFIWATAQGVRKLTSKLSHALQDYSFINLALVRGKEYWRVTGSQKLGTLYDLRLPLFAREVLIRALAYLHRLSPEGQKDETLFKLMRSFSQFCFLNRPLCENRTEIESLFLLFQIKALAILGYGPLHKDLKELISPTTIVVFNSSDLIYVALHKDLLQKEIEKALRESQL